MKKFVCLVLLIMGLVLLTSSVAMAQGQGVVKNTDSAGKETQSPNPGSLVFSGASVGAGIGIGISLLGAGLGFGRIGSAALESMARQPEKAGQIQGAMITIAALLEGATFFALLVCLLLVLRANI